MKRRCDPNGIRTHFELFAALGNSARNMRQTSRYERKRGSASLHESRRITQFKCPILSEILLFAPRARDTMMLANPRPELFLIAGCQMIWP